MIDDLPLIGAIGIVAKDRLQQCQGITVDGYVRRHRIAMLVSAGEGHGADDTLFAAVFSDRALGHAFAAHGRLPVVVKNSHNPMVMARIIAYSVSSYRFWHWQFRLFPCVTPEPSKYITC